MVIAKWNPFGAQPASTANPKPAPVPVVSSADAKKFGLENVRLDLQLNVLFIDNCATSVREYLVSSLTTLPSLG
jgi:hypothetical protein